jgi:cytidylate kinase
MIIAIDGPAASGKGTLARRLAAHYHLPHLDTGLLYRGVAKAVLDAAAALDDVDSAVTAARSLDVACLDPAVLQRHEIGEAASIVAAMPPVRAVLMTLQREFAAAPPGAVIDGRDIGTVIAPNAEVKIFVTATPEERARRRHAELVQRGDDIDFVTILRDIKRRDDRDRERRVAPLKAADDAHLLDTTYLDIDAAVRAAIDIVEAARAG